MTTNDEQVTCPSCTDGIRSTTPVVIQCGTCWGVGTLSASVLADKMAMAGLR